MHTVAFVSRLSLEKQIEFEFDRRFTRKQDQMLSHRNKGFKQKHYLLFLRYFPISIFTIILIKNTSWRFTFKVCQVTKFQWIDVFETDTQVVTYIYNN